MLEVSESKLAQYSLHFLNETLILGEEAFTQPEVMLEAAFTQLAFSKIDLEQQFEFFHETNIALNEIYTYAKAIFEQNSSFLEQSQNIARHLHSVSQHPNIKSGELFIGLFENCLLLNEEKRLLPLLKLMKKKYF